MNGELGKVTTPLHYYEVPEYFGNLIYYLWVPHTIMDFFKVSSADSKLKQFNRHSNKPGVYL